MPTPPIALTGQNIEELKSQMLILFDELFQERVGGTLLGDVFTIGSDDILTLGLDTVPGIEKSNGGLKVIVKATGGLTLDSNGLSIKIATPADLSVDSNGLALTGFTKFAFVTIACPAGTNPVADAAADQLNLAVGSNKLTITGTAGTDTVTFDVVQANIDHDALANFAANEHIDWTNATAALLTTSTVRSNAGFNMNGSAGASGAVTVLTAIQAGGAGPLGIQYKNRVVTYSGGLATTIGAESAWTDI